MSVREGGKQTEVGVIPEEWKSTSLKSCTKLIKDGTHGSHKNVADGIPLLSAKDINDGRILIPNDCRKISNSDFYNIHKNYEIKNNDLLLTVVGTLGRLALVKNYHNNFTLQRSVAIIRSGDNTTPEYLYYSLESEEFQNQLKKRSNASAQAGVYLGELEQIKIPIPPLPEQQKIAAILTSVDNKIEVIDEQIAKTETLKKGLMQKLLSEGIGHSEFKDSEIGRIPKEWEVVSLGKICNKIVGGGTPSKKNNKYWHSGTIPWATVKDMADSKYLSSTEDKITSIGLNESSANIIPAYNIITATRMAVGRFYINKTDMAINQDLKGLIIKDDFYRDYIYWALLSKADILEAKGTGTTVKGISLVTLKKLPLPIPPFPEQKQIAKILSNNDDKLDTLRTKKEKYETLKKGLMQKLLTGEVRVNV